ncbi:MAG: AraC family transcriptional regulator [Clostridiales bacterium]|jgi:AraC family transcriptional regulator|nr:AraC family transcriptional regulator [Clostridiales bacterium]
MDWLKRMNDAIAYIETHLDDEVDYAEAAKITHCSVYHFSRVFSYMANTSVAEYIRRRRLTLAAVDLRNGGAKVLDVAIKYGYNSPTAFSRAFAQFHGAPPSEAKNDGVMFTSYPPISFQITVKGVTAMNYRIEKKEAIRVVGAKLTTTMDEGKNLREIPEFWEQNNQSGQSAKIAALINKEPLGLLGVCVMPPDGGAAFDYYIAAPTDKPAPEGMAEYVIPASQYAIFESVGPLPHTLQNLTQRVFTEWLPTSGYEYGNAADIEVYSDGDTAAKDYKAEVWVPIVKK